MFNASSKMGRLLRAAMPVTFASRLCLLISLAVMVTWLGMAAVAHGQAANQNAFPPYDTRTPEKRVNITIVDDPLTVGMRRTKTTPASVVDNLGALAYAGSSSHHVQVGIFPTSGTTTTTKLRLHSRNVGGNQKQSYLVYTFTDEASQCIGNIFPPESDEITDGRIFGGREMRTHGWRTHANPLLEETIPLQGSYRTLSNHTAQQASGKHLCVGLRFHHEGDSAGQSELRAFSYYMDDTAPTLAGNMIGNTLTLTATDADSEIFQYRYIKKSCDTAGPTEAGWKSLAAIDGGDGVTSKRLVSNKQVEIVFADGVDGVYCFDAQDMQKNVGRLTVRPPGVTLNWRSVSVSEGSSAYYTVVLDSPPTAPVTVTPTSGSPAKATVSPASRTFTPSHWNTAQRFTVTGVDAGTSAITHAATSADTDYSISAVGTVTATVTEQAAETTRVSLSATPQVAAKPQVEEGYPVTVTATLSEALSRAVRIPLFQQRGTAEPGDYEQLRSYGQGGTFGIDIPAGQLTGTTTVQTTRDADGDSETFSVAISPPFLPSGVQLGDPYSAQVTIIDSAQVVQIWVMGPPSFVVHEDRDRGARFVVHLGRAAASHSFTVDYTTKDGTVSTQYRPRPKPYVANNCGRDQNGNSLDNYNWCKIPNSQAATAPADYTTTAGTLTFAPGETQKLVFVPIVNDTVEDSDENFGFEISNPSAGARIAYLGGDASVVILNDEADLSALTVEGAAGAGGPWSALDIGAFEAETTGYAVTAPYGTTHARLTPTAAEPGTTMRTGAGSNLEAVRSGETGPAVALGAGENTLIVAAVAPSGARKTYTVTVTLPTNDAPTVASAIADATITSESGTRQVSLSGVFDDADGDALTVTASSSDENFATVSVSADSSTLTATARNRGTATVTVTASDGNGGTVDDTFTVTVKAAPAVASAIDDISGLEAGDSRTISMSGVFSDADGDAVTVTQASSSDSAVAAVSAAIDGATAAITAVTVTASSEGTATITVTARDADGNTVQDAFDVTVNAAEQQQQRAVELPGPVLGLELTATHDSVSVGWSAPESGDAPDGYIVNIKRQGGGDGETRRPGAGKTSLTFRDLNGGSTYEVWVRAQNEAGKGERTHATVTLPVELPGPVTGLEVAATGDGVTVSWSAPETGGAPDGYIVHIRPEDGATGSGKTRTPRAKKTKVSFENLEAGQTYKVWVRAQNEAGKGERVHASITLPEAEPPPESGDGQTGQ